MKRRLNYPLTKTLSENVISASGAIPVGCKVKKGKIIPALSPVKGAGQCPANVGMTAYSAGTKKFFVWADGVAYSSTSGTSFVEMYPISSKFPFVFDRREGNGFKAYFAGDDFCITHTGQIMSSWLFDMPVYGGVFRYGRLFGIDNGDPLKLRWSGEGGAFDWNEGVSGAGWVNLDGDGGEILDLVNFNDKLCAVRKRGITVINAFGAPENFTVKYIDTKTPEIFKSTAAVAGGKLIFCTECGLYAFGGSDVVKIDCGLAEDILSPKYAVSLGCEYFVCGESRSLNRGAVLAYDAEENSAYLVDVEADALLSNGKIFTYKQSKACTLKSGGAYEFISGNLFFSSQRKVLKCVEADCDGEMEIEVSNGVKSRIFGGQFKKIYPKMSGESFKITVRGKGEVRNVTAYAEMINGV